MRNDRGPLVLPEMKLIDSIGTPELITGRDICDQDHQIRQR